YLKRWGHRLVLHYLPLYAPETNPVERVWWHLHDEITRNHQCHTLEELLDLVFRWLEDGNPFTVEGSVYPTPRVACLTFGLAWRHLVEPPAGRRSSGLRALRG